VGAGARRAATAAHVLLDLHRSVGGSLARARDSST
jgi:hypothetical protein